VVFKHDVVDQVCHFVSYTRRVQCCAGHAAISLIIAPRRASSYVPLGRHTLFRIHDVCNVVQVYRVLCGVYNLPRREAAGMSRRQSGQTNGPAAGISAVHRLGQLVSPPRLILTCPPGPPLDCA